MSERSCSSSPVHPYVYASDDPIDLIDPSGRAEAAVEYAVDLREVLLRVVQAGTIYYFARALALTEKCAEAKQACINQCTEDVLMQSGGPRDKSGEFFKCMHRCMEAAGCE